MKWHEILIRYGEISTKGKNRKQFISRLRENLRFVFQDVTDLRIRSEHDRMYLRSSHEHEMAILLERLPRVFGAVLKSSGGTSAPSAFVTMPQVPWPWPPLLLTYLYDQAVAAQPSFA